MTTELRRSICAEFFGTFVLVFAGTSAIVVNDVTNGAISHVGVALTFGLVVLALIYALGDISGCHLNPAVTIGFSVARRFNPRFIVPYVLAQCLGAVAASETVHLLFPDALAIGNTVPRGSLVQSFALEFILTLILMFVVLSVSTGSKEKGVMAGVAVGSVIAFEAMFAGPISGASMNPARSFGPSAVTFQLATLWIYVLAPILGAGFSVFVCRCVQLPGCCEEACK